MKWILIIWIAGCAIDCPIETVEQRTYDTREDCETALAAWKLTSKPHEEHVGVCVGP